MRWTLGLLFFLVGCCNCPVAPDGNGFQVSLSPERAERGEEVTVTLSVAKAEGARVLVGGTEVDFGVTDGTTLVFEAPEDIESGSQEVLIILDTEASASRTLGVLGNDIVQDQVMIVLEPPPGQTSIDEDALREFLEQREFNLIEFSTLEGNIGPCSGELALIDVNGVPLGQALEELEELEAEGIAVLLGLDGRSVQSGGQIPNYLSAIRAEAAFESRLGGAGVTIAVLDSGVNPDEELAERLLEGYNAIDDTTDTPDDDIHGTPIAFLAAGTTFGVAQEASVLPVKVCDDNTCFSSDVVKGMCWALDNAPDGPEQLVMNLSLGGDNPTEIIESLLSAAIDEGVAVAASGGNEGNGGPARYPAAHNLDGLMAVGSVEQNDNGDWTPSIFSTWGTRSNMYINIAAPRIDLDSDGLPVLGNLPPNGDNIDVGRTTGTSFSTPLVTGTMAVLRGADANLSPQQMQACIEQGAQKLPNPPNDSLAVGAGLLDVEGALSACQ